MCCFPPTLSVWMRAFSKPSQQAKEAILKEMYHGIALCNICALKPLWNTNPAAHYTWVSFAVWMLSLMWFHSASRNLCYLNGICCVIPLQYFGPGGVPSCELKRWILEKGSIVGHFLWEKHFLILSLSTLICKHLVHYLFQKKNTAFVVSQKKESFLTILPKTWFFSPAQTLMTSFKGITIATYNVDCDNVY